MQTIISGMGELHLDIYVERMKREYNVDCVTGKPRVAFRETITQPAAFNYAHKKQTGGSGQYGKVVGKLEPMTFDEETGLDSAFENRVVGGAIPASYIPAIEKVSFPPGLQLVKITCSSVSSRRASATAWTAVSSLVTK